MAGRTGAHFPGCEQTRGVARLAKAAWRLREWFVEAQKGHLSKNHHFLMGPYFPHESLCQNDAVFSEWISSAFLSAVFGILPGAVTSSPWSARWPSGDTRHHTPPAVAGVWECSLTALPHTRVPQLTTLWSSGLRYWPAWGRGSLSPRLTCRRIHFSLGCFLTTPACRAQSWWDARETESRTFALRHEFVHNHPDVCSLLVKTFSQLLFPSECCELENFWMLLPCRQSIGSRLSPFIPWVSFSLSLLG